MMSPRHLSDTAATPYFLPLDLLFPDSLSLDRVPFGKLFLADAVKLTDAASLSTNKLDALIFDSPLHALGGTRGVFHSFIASRRRRRSPWFTEHDVLESPSRSPAKAA